MAPVSKHSCTFLASFATLKKGVNSIVSESSLMTFPFGVKQRKSDFLVTLVT